MPLVKTPEDMVASVLELAGLTEASSDLLLDLGSVAAPKKCFNDLESWAKLFSVFTFNFFLVMFSCGDGRVCLAAARIFPAVRAVGIDMNMTLLRYISHWFPVL